jgi:hypothetical protein
VINVFAYEGARIAPPSGSYVFSSARKLTTSAITRSSHRIGAALAENGVPPHIADYRGEPRRVQDALGDDRCSFLVCFNEFGSELSVAHQERFETGGQSAVAPIALIRRSEPSTKPGQVRRCRGATLTPNSKWLGLTKAGSEKPTYAHALGGRLDEIWRRQCIALRGSRKVFRPRHVVNLPKPGPAWRLGIGEGA